MAQTIQHRTINILHVADLHANLSSLDRLKQHCEKFLADPLLQEKRIDLLIFAGDIADFGTLKEFELAKKIFFEPLCEAKDIKPDRIFLVPGDHDVYRYWDWTSGVLSRKEKEIWKDLPEEGPEETKKTWLQKWLGERVEGNQISAEEKARIEEAERERCEFEKEDETVRKQIKKTADAGLRDYISQLFEKQNGRNQRLENFYAFREKLTGKPSREDPSCGFVEIRGMKIAVCCFNSSWRSRSSDKDGRHLFISDAQLDAAQRQMRAKLNDEADTFDLKIAVCHHRFGDEMNIVEEHAEQRIHNEFAMLLGGHTHQNKSAISGQGKSECLILTPRALHLKSDTDRQIRSLARAEHSNETINEMIDPVSLKLGYRLYEVDLFSRQVTIHYRRLNEEDGKLACGPEKDQGNNGNRVFSLCQPTQQTQNASQQETALLVEKVIQSINQAIQDSPPRVSSRFIGKHLFQTLTTIGNKTMEADFCTVAVPIGAESTPDEHLLVVAQRARESRRILCDGEKGKKIYRRRTQKRSISWRCVDDSVQNLWNVQEPIDAQDFVACYRGTVSEYTFPVKAVGHTPHLRPDRLLAVVNLESTKRGHFSGERLKLVQHLAEMLPTAISNLHLHNTFQVSLLEERVLALRPLLPLALIRGPFPLREVSLSRLELQPFLDSLQKLLCSLAQIPTDDFRYVSVEAFYGDPGNANKPRILKRLHNNLASSVPRDSPVAQFIGHDGFMTIPNGLELSPHLHQAARHVSIVTLPLGVSDHKITLVASLHTPVKADKDPDEDEAVLLLFHHLVRNFSQKLDRWQTGESQPKSEGQDTTASTTIVTEFENALSSDTMQRKGWSLMTEPEAEAYIRDLKTFRDEMKKNLVQVLEDNLGSLHAIVPALMFREAWPVYQDDHIKVPLRPYTRTEDGKGVPRKIEDGMAKWLFNSLTTKAGECAVKFYVVGDSLSDRKLAENLSRLNSCPVNLYLMNPSLATGSRKSSRGKLQIQVFDKWTDLCEVLCDEVQQDANSDSRDRRSLRFMILDIDQTTILPRNICGNEIEEARFRATKAYVEQQMGPQNDTLSRFLDENFASAKDWPPYKDGQDEDRRALCTLLLQSKLITKEDFAQNIEIDNLYDLGQWLEYTLKLAKEQNNMPQLSQHLEWVQRAYAKKTSTLLFNYRQQEEIAFRWAGNRFKINGHIVEALSLLCDLKVNVIGYSDRPGVSMGVYTLTDSEDVAWPIDGNAALVMRPVPLGREGEKEAP